MRRNRRPRQLRGDVRRDREVGRERQRGVATRVRRHFEASVLRRRGVDADHQRDVQRLVERRESGCILVRREPGAARQLVVDLLFEQHGRFAEQRRDHRERARPGDQSVQPVVILDEVLDAAQLSLAFGRAFEVLHPLARRLGPFAQIVDPRRQLRTLAGVETVADLQISVLAPERELRGVQRSFCCARAGAHGSVRRNAATETPSGPRSLPLRPTGAVAGSVRTPDRLRTRGLRSPSSARPGTRACVCSLRTGARSSRDVRASDTAWH